MLPKSTTYMVLCGLLAIPKDAMMLMYMFRTPCAILEQLAALYTDRGCQYTALSKLQAWIRFCQLAARLRSTFEIRNTFMFRESLVAVLWQGSCN